MNCDPNALMEAAKCFKCIPRKSQREVLIYLFCQLVNSETPCELPAAPGDLGVAAGFNKNTLTWPAVVGATSYNIKRALVTGGPYATIDTDNASPYVDATALAGTDYFYVVSAVNACGEGANSNQSHGIPTGDFQFTPIAQNVDWTDGGGSHTGNLANFNATAVKATTTIIQFDGHAVQTVSYFGEANLPAITLYTSTGCNSLTSVVSPDLISVTVGMAVFSCPVLTTLNLTSLTIGTDVVAQLTPSLASLNLPSLTTAKNFYDNGSTNLLTINAPALTAVTVDVFCYGNLSLTTANFQSLQTVGNDFYVYTNSNMTSLNVSSLVTVGHHFNGYTSPKLTTLSCPALTGIGNEFRFEGCTLLANVSLPVFVPKNSNSIRFDGCALTAASVNHILARCVANPALTVSSVLLMAGTSSAPTGQGILDKATLIARGCTITTN